jgi:hypothetical protein
MRALSRDPSQRYATAGELRTALLAVSRGEVPAPLVSQAPAPPPPPADDSTVAVITGPEHTPAGGVPVLPVPKPRRRARSRVIPILITVLVAAALIVGGVLISGTSRSPGGNGTPADASKGVHIASAVPFDPFGDAHEHDSEASLAIDGNSETRWQTEGYAQRTFGTKPGVGLALVLDSTSSLAALKITSDSNDWAFDVYVADRAAPTLDGWGQPVASKTHTHAGTTSVDLKGTKGGAVLVWITDVGEEAGGHAYINEAQIIAE